MVQEIVFWPFTFGCQMTPQAAFFFAFLRTPTLPSAWLVVGPVVLLCFFLGRHQFPEAHWSPANPPHNFHSTQQPPLMGPQISSLPVGWKSSLFVLGAISYWG